MTGNLERLTNGLVSTWAGFLRDWDRTLRAGNYPGTTRYNYLLAVAQLARYLDDHRSGLDAEAAAMDPVAVRRAQLESFQAWMVQTRSPSTAMNKYKALQQFLRWLVQDEEVIDRSPMERVRQPKTPPGLGCRRSPTWPLPTST
ncbi:phage integrase N-terminal SAM-like domain-containing protein [Phytohabitans kaempferiae]|uniref:Phage integrase N-terminal SAM-like domain-containing protein n=1 Tax=Phytohabitans kaempferiae TaxID=1620943 RepID=A0ABV6M3I4_9ACTN